MYGLKRAACVSEAVLSWPEVFVDRKAEPVSNQRCINCIQSREKCYRFVVRNGGRVPLFEDRDDAGEL